MRSFINMRTTR